MATMSALKSTLIRAQHHFIRKLTVATLTGLKQSTTITTAKGSNRFKSVSTSAAAAAAAATAAIDASAQSNNSTAINPDSDNDSSVLINNQVWIGTAAIAKRLDSKLIKSAPNPISGSNNTAGEDSFFVQLNSSFVALGVADGVGGWAGVPGADPAAYSAGLMRYAYDKSLETAKSIPNRIPAPIELLQYAYNSMCTHKRHIVGSSTACIVVYDPLKQLIQWCNIGDSGFILIRSGRLHLRCAELQHAFNTPYQLGTGSSDKPIDSSQSQYLIQPDDILIIGTDGLFDNLSESDIVTVVNKHIQKRNKSIVDNSSTVSPVLIQSNNLLAAELAQYAHICASNPNHNSPFQQSSYQQGYPFKGGKMDDISIIVSEFKQIPISQQSKSESESEPQTGRS